jgi:hypothetical protein
MTNKDFIETFRLLHPHLLHAYARKVGSATHPSRSWRNKSGKVETLLQPLTILGVRCLPSGPHVARASKANNPQQSWGFEGEPPEAVIKGFWDERWDFMRTRASVASDPPACSPSPDARGRASRVLPRSGFLAPGKFLEFSAHVPPVLPHSAFLRHFGVN